MSSDHIKNSHWVSGGEDISAGIKNYVMSIEPEKRLSTSWMLNEIFHSGATRLDEFVHRHDPSWDWGAPFDTVILDGY